MERVELSNVHLSVVFVPELGGKMVSFFDRDLNHEWLLSPPEPERGYQAAGWGAAFEEFDTSGFDECIPTVSECRYPLAPYQGAVLPDHGELWSVPWQAVRRGDELEMSVKGQSLPYTLDKRARLDGRRLVLDYQLTSRAEHAFHYMWSSHPLLRAEPGARIYLPEEVRGLYLNWSAGDRIGKHGDEVAWPRADLATLGPASLGHAEKLFTGRLSAGWCALWVPGADASLTFRFDPADVPYVGLWICQGGWPESRPQKHYTVALEPCSGRPDSLAEAIARGEADRIEPGQTRRWTLSLEPRKGPPDTRGNG